jgi:hypothetical protein
MENGEIMGRSEKMKTMRRMESSICTFGPAEAHDEYTMMKTSSRRRRF